MGYLKYLLPSAVLTLTGLGVLAGGLWVWTGLALFAVMVIPDMLMGFDFSSRRISRVLTFEIVTHSQRHTDLTVPYWKLKAYQDVPLVGNVIGYFFLSLVPPRWHRVMRKHLARWDNEFANSAEKVLAKKPILMQVGYRKKSALVIRREALNIRL